ncbi:precorrin-3B C(17)-methyltransferase [Spirochaeta cellobiosiphila]|uniref:precorrin-3B C(17)-methyltransferase n=1 Tax=Spirochaeta cellobiosiphila TaxID=504483 RepID=UPI0004276CF8|nr:precorrin-3B C(17)-methyltransferase [Spirochaeta cellobiosiphila]
MIKPKLYVIGIGPGDGDYIIPAARTALEESELIVGYGKYLNLLGPLIENKECFTSGMTKEIDRVKYAVDQALTGRSVAIVSSGDSGVYGMAGLAYELWKKGGGLGRDIQVVPGITAANSCAALLGAPLMHDYAVISLSDLLTERSLIVKRLELASQGDFVTVLYNPKSKKRVSLIEEARQIFLQSRSPQTPVGMVTAAYREACDIQISTLEQMSALYENMNMNSTVIIGNSQSRRWGDVIITPRGYPV